MISGGQPQARILCVEDSDGEFLESLLQPAFGVVVAATLREGIQLARQSCFDLYLIDYVLPDGDGLDLTRSVRRFDPNTPVIIYSSIPEPCESMGDDPATYFVSKFAHPEYLIQTVLVALEEAELNEAAARAAEMQAIQDELRSQLAGSMRQAAALRDDARQKFAQIAGAIEQAEFRVKQAALRAFTSAGGTRALFERLWPELQRSVQASTGTPTDRCGDSG